MNIQNLIDKALKEKQDKKKERENSGKFVPSSFGRCFRYQVWRRQGTPPSNEPDERTLRVWEAGSIFHKWVEDLIEADKEVKTETDDFLGFADIVTNDTVVDLKTVHSRMFWRMSKSDYDTTKEQMPHWLQVAFYGWQLGKDKISLCYISKDDLCINQYFQNTADWEDKLLWEIAKLQEYWEKKELPPAKGRAYGLTKEGKSKECEVYCPYRDKCRGGV